MHAHTETVDRAQLIPSGTGAQATKRRNSVRMLFTPGATDAGRGKLLFLRSGCWSRPPVGMAMLFVGLGSAAASSGAALPCGMPCP